MVRAPSHRAAVPPGPESPLRALVPLSLSVSPVAGAPPASEPVGERAAAPGRGAGPITLTEDVGTVLRRVVVQEFEAQGLRVVESGGSAHVALRLAEFAVDAPRQGTGWEVITRVRLALRVSERPGDEGWDEFVYTAERSRQSPIPPGVRAVEEVLAGVLADLGRLVAERPGLARALAARAGSER